MSEKLQDVLVIGGGLHGCSVALFLARAGYRVTVVEKSLAGRHASSVNAGGLRLLMRDIREYPLSVRAMEMWENLGDYVGARAAKACEIVLGTSQIALALDENEVRWAEAREKEMRGLGIRSEELIEVPELHRLLPGLTDSVMGGLISRRDGHANPANAARAFRLAAENAGARIVEGCGVQALNPIAGGGWRVQTERGMFEAGQVVNCAGAWGDRIAALVDEKIPLRVKAASMMVTARVKPFIKPVVIGIDQPLSFKQSTVGSLVIGGGILGKPCPDQGTSFTVMDRMRVGASATIAAFPALASVPILRTWTGLEGTTPDGVPHIGPSQNQPGLWHVFGFCGHGFQISPSVGEAVANSIINGRIDEKLLTFRPDRFAQTKIAQQRGT